MIFGGRSKLKSVKDTVEQLQVQLTCSESEVLEKLQMIDLNTHDLKRLKYLSQYTDQHIEYLVDQFYDTILQVPELREIISENSSVTRLKSVIQPHLLSLFDGVIDDQFLNKRLQVAKVHYRIGLKPAWYLAAFQGVQSTLIQVITKEIENPEDWFCFIESVTKILNLEQQIVLEAYEEETTKGMRESFQQGRVDIQRAVLDVSDQLVASSQEAKALIDTLVRSSSEVESISNEGHEQAEATKKIGVAGQKSLQLMLEKVQMIAENIESMSGIVANVESSSNQITGVVKIVQDIAEQTNLLALNSAIEAARAGEHGRGFAVVADEVRNLADQTKSSISTINGLVKNSNQYTKELIASLVTVTKEVEESSDASRSTYQDFEKIIGAMESNLETNAHIQKQASNQTIVLSDIEEVVDIVVDSADKLHEVVEVK